ncbi:MAG: BMP family ABC transporter substrate-binding protein [Burkholderiaceae bacterium]
MFVESKRVLMKAAALSALSAIALVGCGKKEEVPLPPPPASAASVAEAPAPKAEPLKVAFVYIWTAGDAGWTFAHDLGRKEVEAEFGDKVKTTIVEKVPEGADAERVIRDLATQGNKLIFATSFGYMEPMLKVAAEFPDVKFEHATGYKTAPNMGIYDSKFYEPAYMAGVVAGKMTKTNTIGFVGSFPIPEVLRNINAFTLGAQSTNPKVKTKVVWVSTWSDPPKEGDAAQSLINGGADVLLQNTDSTAVLQTAEKNGKYAFGWDSDMSAFAPKAHLGSAIANWGGYYKQAVKSVMDGSWKTERTVWGVKEGMNDFIKAADAVPADVKARLDEIKAGMKAGSFEVFTGPIVDSTGKERLAKDVKADQDWKDKVDFYVKGVEGKIPSGK